MGATGHGSSHLKDDWADVLRHDAAVHLLLMASIVAGVFQGYMKDRMGGAIPYALADACMAGAVLIWFGKIAVQRRTVRGSGGMLTIIIMAVFIPVTYLLIPGTPVLVKMAGLRIWVLFPLVGLVAVNTIQSTGQIRAYTALVVILGLIAGAYGIYQFQIGPEAALVSPFGEARHGFTVFYALDEGQSEFRAFSTFTFPAPFANFMVVGMLLAVGAALSKRHSRSIKGVAWLALPVLFLGMTVSGTRAALIVLLSGLVVAAWLRGLTARQFLFVPIALVAAHFASVITAGRAAGRFASTVLNESDLWLRIIAPVTIAGRALRDHIFGMGLGRSGNGVPYQIVGSLPSDFFVGSDGDLGRVAVELGIVGVFLLLAIILGVIPLVAKAARQLAKTDSDDVAIGVGAIIVSSSLMFLIGSPLTSVPSGTLWWLFSGALIRLMAIARDVERRKSGQPEQRSPLPGQSLSSAR